MTISKTLTLPSNAVTRRLAILAMSGAGKSNAAAVIAERFFDSHAPFVVIDPKGDWFGLRSDATGKGPGLPIPIFGGLHGDVRLEPTGGKVIGELIAEERLTCILDVSEFDTRQEMFRFLADLASTLLKKNRDPLHIFAEEADEYLPQKPGEKGYAPICLGAWQRLVKRGRFRGLGVTLISQRTASLNKDVLNMAEALIGLRTTAPHDRAAIKKWVVEYASEQSDLVDSLPGLDDGEAWIWSPQWLKRMERTRFPLRRTFDSGKTPEIGSKRRRTTLAEIDLSAVSKRMAETIERAKADDPAELRKQLVARAQRIAELERHRCAPPAAPAKSIEVPVLTDDDRALLGKLLGGVEASPEAVAAKLAARIDTALAPYRKEIGSLAHRLGPILKKVDRVGAAAAAPVRPSTPAAPLATRAPVARPTATPGAAGAGTLSAMVRGLLTALAQHPEGLTKGQVRLHAGYADSGPVSTSFGQMAREGWTESDGARVKITPAGSAALGAYEPLPLGAELRAFLLTSDKLSTMEKGLLQAACAIYPNDDKKGVIRTAAGYADSGPVSTAFAKLLRYGYLEQTAASRVRASDRLFDLPVYSTAIGHR